MIGGRDTSSARCVSVVVRAIVKKAGVFAAGSDTIADTVRHTADIARGGHLEVTF